MVALVRVSGGDLFQIGAPGRSPPQSHPSRWSSESAANHKTFRVLGNKGVVQRIAMFVINTRFGDTFELAARRRRLLT